MNIVTKSIRESTGLNIGEFCTQYLESDWQAFTVRLRKNKLYPNEAILICLLTGKNPQELFGISSIDVFYLKGKDSVSDRVRELLSKPNALEKMNLVLNNQEGLKISFSPEKKVQKKSPIKKAAKEKVEIPKEKIAEEEFDFVELNIFKK